MNGPFLSLMQAIGIIILAVAAYHLTPDDEPPYDDDTPGSI